MSRETTDRTEVVPTTAKPGSAEKIEILRQRVAAGQSLWHADDCTDPPPPAEFNHSYTPGVREIAVRSR